MTAMIHLLHYKTFITYSLPDSLDPLQVAYRANTSTDDTITLALHTALSQLDQRNTYVRMLFIDYSSAFSPFVPSKLVTKIESMPRCTEAVLTERGGPTPY